MIGIFCFRVACYKLLYVLHQQFLFEVLANGVFVHSNLLDVAVGSLGLAAPIIICNHRPMITFTPP